MHDRYQIDAISKYQYLIQSALCSQNILHTRTNYVFIAMPIKTFFFSLYFVLIQCQWFYAKFHFSYPVPGHCTFFLSITIYVIFQMVLHSLFVFFVFVVVIVITGVVVVVSETIILCFFCSKGRVNSKRMSLSSGKVANVRVLFIFTKQFAMTMQPSHCVLCAYCSTNDVWITWAQRINNKI